MVNKEFDCNYAMEMGHAIIHSQFMCALFAIRNVCRKNYECPPPPYIGEFNNPTKDSFMRYKTCGIIDGFQAF